MRTIYCISGLAADERAFAGLQIEGYRLTFLPWIIPHPNESIADYAGRMKQGIVEANPILMGLSFGGMMCIEIAKLMQVEKLILISSIRTRAELPWWMKAAGAMRLDRVVPLRSSGLTEPIQNRFIGVTNRQELEMVRAYRRNAPQPYVNWAIDQVLRWKNEWQPGNLFQIHGGADRMFPIKNVSPTHVIPNGGHLMIINKAAEVNAALKQILGKP